LRIEASGPRLLSVAPRIDDGKLLYRVELPEGTIRQGDLAVAGEGRADVGPFETRVSIPPPIEVSTSLPPGTVIPYQRPFTVTWRGGDPDSVVRLRVITRRSPIGDLYWFHYWYECPAAATQGRVTLDVSSDGPRFHLPVERSDDVEVVLSVGPKDPEGERFSVRGLARGGRHHWSYLYRWGQLRIE